MKRHFMRHKWLYLAVVVLTVWPVILAQTWRSVPGPDEASVRTLVTWMDGELQRRYGEYLGEEAMRITNQRSVVDLTSDARWQRLKEAPSMTSVAALASEIEGLSALSQPLWSAWDDLSRRGVGFVLPSRAMQLAMDATGEVGYIGSNYLALMIGARMRRQKAVLLVERKEWDAALSELRATAHMADGARGGLAIGHLIAIAVRGMAYGGYARLLAADPPAEVCRASISDLVGLRDTEPWWEPLELVQEQLQGMYLLLASAHGSRGNDLKAASKNFALRQWYLPFLIVRTAGHAESFHSPALLRYLRRHGLERIPLDVDYYPNDADTQKRFLQWTGAPAQVRFLDRAMQECPEIASIPGMPRDVQDRIDPWTRLWVARPLSVNLNHARIRTTVCATQRRVLELAFAARLYRREHDRWPASVDELVPAYVPAEMEREGQPLSFQPEHIATFDVDDKLAITLYRHFLPEVVGASIPDMEVVKLRRRYPMGDATDPLKDIRVDLFDLSRKFIGNESYRKGPVLAVCVFDSLLACRQLVESATLLMLSGGGNAWVPMDREYARRLTDISDVVAKVVPPGFGGGPTPDYYTKVYQGEGQFPPEGIRIVGKLKKPDRVFAAWTPGPDQDDDGGRISYDPTNGIASNGDIVQYVLD